jgi:hypothetical protein
MSPAILGGARLPSPAVAPNFVAECGGLRPPGRIAGVGP